MQARVQRRAQNANTFTDAYDSGTSEWIFRGRGLSLLDAGNLIRSKGSTYGQCAEMCCVAVSMFLSGIPDAPVRVAFMTPPGDHAFVIVGKLPEEFRRVADLAQLSLTDDSWVIDVWANIYCQSSLYAQHFQAQMAHWEGYGKLVESEGDPLLPTHYGNENMTADLVVLDPRVETLD
jgi:hypothetical protein